jgi:hypothetical protein
VIGYVLQHFGADYDIERCILEWKARDIAREHECVPASVFACAAHDPRGIKRLKRIIPVQVDAYNIDAVCTECFTQMPSAAASRIENIHAGLEVKTFKVNSEQG